MTRIAPPSPPHPLGQHTGHGSGQTAVTTVGGAAGTLARLHSGAILEGVVTGRDNAGATQLRTAQGTLSLPLFPPPSVGSSVTIELQISGNQVRAAVLAIRPAAGGPTVPVNTPGAGTGAQTGTQPGQGAPAAAPAPHGPTSQGTQPHGTLPAAGKPAGAPATAPQGTGIQPAGPHASGAGPASQGQGAPGMVAAAPSAPPAAPPALAAALGLSQDWPALRVALDALVTTNPQAAQALQATLPAPNAELPTNMLFFLTALGRGDVRGFLGREAERALRAGGEGPLLERLTGDLAEIKRVSAEPRPDGFRLFLIPFHDGARLEQIRFLVRDHEEERRTTGNRTGPATRFIFDVTMSRLGHIQLDGLAAEGHLDLMIRSQQALPAELRAEVTGLYAEAREALGFNGEVAFLVTREFPVDPADQLAPAHEGVSGLVV